MKLQLLIFATVIGLLSTSCKKEKPELGAAPTIKDAEFTYKPSADNPNIIDFTASKSGAVAVWDFGNGTIGNGKSVQAIYPLKGSYSVKLTIFTRGGNVSLIKELTIEKDDLTLLNSPDIVNLTGGKDGKGFKTWVIDSTRDGHFGVGPEPASGAGLIPEWYSAEALQQSAFDLYNDRYSFYLSNFKFEMRTKGIVFLDNLAAGEFPGSYKTSGEDFNAPLEDQLNENWNIIEEEGIKYLTSSGKSFIGFYAGTRKYQILKLSENELSLRYVDANASSPQLAWYLRLVPEGYEGEKDPGGGGEEPEPEDTTTYALPIDFETIKPVTTSFGDNVDTIISNPHKTGINTSDFVLESKKGVETWAGFFINTRNKFDFSTKNTITLKVYAPKTGKLRMKIEDKTNSNTFVEFDALVTKANEWEEISVDFSSAASGTYNRLVLFPSWDEANAGTFYIDDIEQK